MKKIISFILLITIILSLFTTVSFAASSDDGVDEKTALLQKLNIIGEISDFDRSVTRAEFVQILAEFLEIDCSVKMEERYYADISEDDELWNITGQLVRCAILTVPGDRMFRPGDTVLRSEAVCALMKGYGAGTFEYEMYSEIASRMNLLKDVSYGELNFRDVINLLYNALIGYPLTFTGDGIAQGRKTYMQIHYDMFYTRGTVNAVNRSAVDGNTPGRTGTIRVDDLVISCDTDDLYQYLGKTVGVFYTSEDEPHLFYIYSVTNDDNIIKITEKNYPEFDEKTFALKYYGENDKLRTVRLSETADVIFNGENMTDDIKGAFAGFKAGEITVVASDTQDKSDTVIIESYYNISVMSVSESDCLIYGKDGTVIDADTDERPVYIRDSAGNDMALESVTKDSVVSVYESNAYLKLIVSNTVINGTISGVQEEDKTTKLVIAENEYEFFPGSSFVYNLGNKVSLYLDYNGYITEIKTARADGMTYGWITGYYLSDKLGDKGVRLKVFTEDGVFIELSLANNTRIDGTSRKTPDLQIYGLEQGKSGVADQMILFKADENNVVKDIDTVFPNLLGGGLIKEFSNAEGTYDSLSVGKLIWTSNATIVFVLPSGENRDDEDSYAIGTRSLLESWGTNDVDSYRSTDHDKPGAAEVLALHRDNTDFVSNQKGAFIVKGVHQEWDQDEDTVHNVVTLMSGSSTKEYSLADSFTKFGELEKGNVITIGLNGRNELSAVTLLYGVDENGNVVNTQKEVGGWSDSLHYIAVGKIVAIGDDYADLSVTGDNVPTVRFPIGTTNIGVFDANTRNLCRVGIRGDISEAMMREDIVVLSMYRGTMLSIAIVKK